MGTDPGDPAAVVRSLLRLLERGAKQRDFTNPNPRPSPNPNHNPSPDPNLTPTLTLTQTLTLTLTLASYFAVAFAGCDVYLAFRYANLEARRTYLLDLDHSLCLAERVSLVTSYCHAGASVLWLLLWSVGPPDGRWSEHLAIFSACIVLRYVCALGNYLENAFGSPRQRKRVLRKHTSHEP